MVHPMVLMTTSITICGWVLSWLQQHRDNQWKTFLQRVAADTRITLVDSQTSCEDVCSRILAGTTLGDLQILGFDCEWVTKDDKTRPVSLLQLASRSGECGLFRLCRLKDGAIPQCVKDLLADRNVLKVGVACWEDSRRLERDYGVPVRGCVDLRHLAIRQKALQSRKGLGLQTLAKEMLGVEMEKSPAVRCSDWEAPELTQSQIAYAANDALVSVDIFTAFLKWRLQQNAATNGSGLPSPADMRAAAKAMCQGLVDVPFSGSNTDRSGKNRRIRPRYRDKDVHSPQYQDHEVHTVLVNQNEIPSGDDGVRTVQNGNDTSSCNGEVGSPPNHEKTPTARRVKGYTVRRSPLYHNCQLLAPDGTLLCTIDRKKVQWYLQKELGELVGEDPLTVRLKFEPSGRPSTRDDRYYLSVKQNVCCVCGQGESYIRKNVVPHEYRKHFPRAMKDHLSHDVLLLCTVCHQRTSFHDNRLRNDLAREFDAPLGSEDNAKFLEDPVRRQARTAAKALLRDDGNTIPADRKSELETQVKEYYNTEELTTGMLEEAAVLETRVQNENFVPHAEKVVGQLLERQNGGLVWFEKRWRRHFLDTMQPRHLPPLWSVDHNHGRLEKVGAARQDGQVQAGGDLGRGLNGDVTPEW